LIRRCPDLTDEQREEIEQLIGRLIGKFLHPCVAALRQQNRLIAGEVPAAEKPLVRTHRSAG